MSKAPVNRHPHEALPVRHRTCQALAGKHQVANSIFVYILWHKRDCVNGKIMKVEFFSRITKEPQHPHQVTGYTHPGCRPECDI